MVQFGSRWPRSEGLAAIALTIALLLARALLVWLMVTAAELLAPTGRPRTIREEVSAFPLRTVLVGMVAGLGIGAASLILAITILGLVAAAALWGLLLVAAITTFAALLEAAPDPKLPRVLGVALFVPILGEIITSLAIIIGLGATIRTSTMIARSSPSTP